MATSMANGASERGREGQGGNAQAASSHKAVAAAFTKLDSLLDSAMGRTADGVRGPIDDNAVASAKGRLLLELSRLSMPHGMEPARELIEQARALRAKLLDEQRMLQRRMDAADVISGVIADAVLAEDSDGTYQPRGALTAPGPQRGSTMANAAGSAPSGQRQSAAPRAHVEPQP